MGNWFVESGQKEFDTMVQISISINVLWDINVVMSACLEQIVREARRKRSFHSCGGDDRKIQLTMAVCNL